MRLAVLLALLLTALLSLTSTVALQTAVVGSETVVTVETTDKALLSLQTMNGGGNAAQTAYYSSNGTSLLLDFSRGNGGQSGYGFGVGVVSTPGDQYRFKGLFRVVNQSKERLCISVYVSAGAPADLAGIYLRTPGASGDGVKTAGVAGTRAPCLWLNPASGYEVDFWWLIQAGSLPTSDGFNVRVEGRRTAW